MAIPMRIRQLNKRYLNRLTGRIARSSRGPFCLVYHVGRRSHKPYQTPIIAIPQSDCFVIALTYGPEVDWYRNVKTAGECRLLWHRREYVVRKIEALEPAMALPHFAPFERVALRLFHVRDFVRMDFLTPAAGEMTTNQ